MGRELPQSPTALQCKCLTTWFPAPIFPKILYYRKALLINFIKPLIPATNPDITMLSLQLVVFFLSFSSALSIHARRDVPSLLNDLASVSSKTNTLASAVNNYNGGKSATLIPIPGSSPPLSKKRTS